jgi:GcrA cell cycle regulator
MTNQYPVSWWTDARVNELKARWSNNETYSEIANAMGAASRSAVIGKAHRLLLIRGAGNHGTRTPRIRVRKSSPRSNGHSPKQRHQMSDNAPDPNPAPIGFANPVTLIELTNTHCRWPGPGATMGPHTLYCGNPVVRGQPYCLTHTRIAYAKPQRGLR